MEAEDCKITNIHNQQIVNSDDLRELLVCGKNINHTVVDYDEELELYNKYQTELLKNNTTFDDLVSDELNVDEYHALKSSEWFMPPKYKIIDVKLWLLKRCKTEIEKERVEEEIRLYEERNLIMLLRFFIFFVDHMRSKGCVWGVGRGSSVASYVLYLIGIHHVDSIKYNLSISEYLK